MKTTNHLMYKGIEISVETITMQTALELLETNSHNRRVRSAHVKMLSEQLVAGEWNFNGDTICISNKGILLDGQHRLMACVETGVSFETIVVRGLEDESQETMDIGSKRSAGDALKLAGFPQGVNLAASLTLIDVWQRHGIMTRSGRYGRITPKQAVDLAHEHEGMVDFVKNTKRGDLPHFFVPSVISAMEYLTTKAHEEDSLEFWNGIAYGEGLKDGDVRLALRRRMLNYSGTVSSQTNQSMQALMIIEAWNHFSPNRQERKLIRVVVDSIYKANQWPDINGDSFRFSKKKEEV